MAKEKKEKAVQVKQGPATYICVGGKMVPMMAAKIDKETGKVLKYKADVRRTIDPGADDERVALLEAENQRMDEELKAVREALDELIAERRAGKGKGEEKKPE